MAVDFKRSISDPVARDIGNETVQGMINSKTVQLGFYTKNANAVWAANNLLRKSCYPFARISFPVNRDHFRLEPGDAFVYSDGTNVYNGLADAVTTTLDTGAITTTGITSTGILILVMMIFYV